MNRMKEKLMQYMMGRNGVDDLAKAESTAVFALLLINLILSFFQRFPAVALLLILLQVLLIAMIVHMYFRVFSKNISKRYAENQKFCTLRYQFVVKKDRIRKEIQQRGQYRFFSCPQCRQRVRVPRGHGKICITCPKCRIEFTKRT